MTREEAKTIFLNRGYIESDGGSYFDGNKWRESITVISEWLKEESCEVITGIPKDYLYDTETEDVLVYRHKYTGKEIHIEKPIKRYRIAPCEDCISRQAVIDAIDKWVKDKHILVALPTDEVTPLFKSIHELPSVNSQEPKTIQEKQAENEKYQKAFDDGYANGYSQARFDYEPKTGRWIKKTVIVNVQNAEVIL